MKINSVYLQRLRRAYAQQQLVLYLGAGCSVASGIPAWDRLVVRLYINGIARRLSSRFQAVPALIPAVGEWAFARQVMPLEVAARKLRGYYRDDDDFLMLLTIMLHGLTGYLDRSRLRPAEVRRLLGENRTLAAVSTLCRHSVPGRKGVRAVITYNYDDLLEKSLRSYPYESIWRSTTRKPGTLPIFHVHGFIPAGGKGGSKADEIVLTEDQYNRAAQDPYSWQNLVQINALSSAVGLMVGLSLTDRNLRRILDSLRSFPQKVENYALLRRPQPWTVEEKDIDVIIEAMKARIRDGLSPGYGPNAMALLAKRGLRKKIAATVRELEVRDLQQEEATLNQLGVHPIWYEEYEEVKVALDSIRRT